MIKSKLDLTGKCFKRLTVLGFSHKGSDGRYWKCKCICGIIKNVRVYELLSGDTVSCGCYSREKTCERNRKRSIHGLGKHPLYKVWASVKDRCLNTNHESYKSYGGRGIAVCPEWINSFQTFYDDMFPGYKKGLQIDREDNEGNYCKDNCRWVTPKQNSRNTRRNSSVLGTNIKTGETVFYQYITDASKDGFQYCNIRKVCLGERNHHKGYTWEYVD